VRVDTTERPTEYLLETRDVVAFRVRGRPRDSEGGAHRQVVIYCEPTMTPTRLARHLRNAAEAFDPSASFLEGAESQPRGCTADLGAPD
jgi:hypothetical protein